MVNLQQSWDNNMLETSSLNNFRSGNNISPDVRSIKSTASHKIKRIRPKLAQKNSKTIKRLKLKRHPEIGFGFSIRGGVEHGTGIFISSIHQYSDAFSQGLQTGDQILRANKIYFNEISHEQAVNYIQSFRSMYLVVLSLGIIPGSKVTLSEYQWMDCYGRPCSPLQTTYVYSTRNENSFDDSNGSIGTRYLEAEDERKVNVVVGDNVKLGLLIRGGSEYGLGIFVAGIDEDSVADRSGIMVGEQVLEVNGIDFLSITHADAAHIIRTSKMMSFILKDVEKIPLARIVYEESEWAETRSLPSKSPISRRPEIKSPSKPLKKQETTVIQPGIAGSQLQHHSITNPMSYRWIEQKAQTYLTEDEWSTLKYYLREYVHESITINGLVLSLFDLLDNSEKMQLIREVRGVVRAPDIDTFDEMVLKKEVQEIEIENESHSREEHESPTISARENVVSGNNIDDVQTPSSTRKKNPFKKRAKKPLLKYNQVSEDVAYASAMDNITEESIVLSENGGGNSPLKQIGEESPFPIQPTYATINKPGPQNSILRNSPIKGLENLSDITNEALKEQNRADGLEEFNENYEEHMDEREDAIGSMTNDYEEIYQHNGNSSISGSSSSSTDFENNKLGFAFSFLTTDDDDKDSVNSESSQNLNTSRLFASRSPSKTATIEKPARSFMKNQSFDSSSSRSPEKQFNDSQNILNKEPETPVRYFRDLQSPSPYNNMVDNYQPKSLAIPHDTFEVEELNTKEESPRNREPNFDTTINGFDATPSLEHRLSNFSINDIIRQSYLPTTRLEYDPKETEKENTVANNTFENQQSLRNRSLTRLSSLNIQNQYEYESKHKPTGKDLQDKSSDDINIQRKFSDSKNRSFYNNKSFTVSNESINKLVDEPKTYGKPVMTKSPRPDFHEPVNFDSLRRKEQVKLSESDDTFYSLSSLKRNTNSNRIRANVISEMINQTNQETINKTYEEEPLDSSTLLRKKLTADVSSFRVVNEDKKVENMKFTKLKKSFKPGVPLVSTDVNESTLSNSYSIMNDIQPAKVILEGRESDTLFNIGRDLKAQDTPSEENNPPKPSSPSMGSIQSRIKAFSNSNGVRKESVTAARKQVGGVMLKNKNTDQKPNTDRQIKSNVNTKVLQIPRADGNPGFTVDVKSASRGNEIYVNAIQNPDLNSIITVGDIITTVDRNSLNKDLKKGLANMIIRNAFNSSDGEHVSITVVKKR